MSRCCCKKKEVTTRPIIMPPVTTGSCCCNFPTLVILILIVLQFSRYGKGGGCDGGWGGPMGNGILFIIALFFLACCNPCRPGVGGFGGGCGCGY